MPKQPIAVYFIYRRGSTYLGSTLLRGVQLCQILNNHGSGAFSYHLMPLRKLRYDPIHMLWARTRPKGAIYVFVKDSIDRLTPEALHTLHERSAAILHDPIDRSLSATPIEDVDLHIASSFTQKEALQTLLAEKKMPNSRVELLLHQADLRLEECHDVPQDTFLPAYFGNPDNAFLTERIRSKILVHDISQADGMAKLIPMFLTANFHYAVRPEEQTTSTDVFKPLTKAVTAASCGVPIMVNRNAHDAVSLLGSDYPFLVDDCDTDGIVEQLDIAASMFGGARWESAIEVMLGLRERVSPSRTAKDFEAILHTLL